MPFPDYSEPVPSPSLLDNPAVLPTAVCLAFGLVVFLIFRWKSSSGSAAEKEPERDRVLIVVSSKEFQVPCVAQATIVFNAAGLGVALCSSTGGTSQPEADSMKSPIAEAAAQKGDKSWLHVLQTSSGPLPQLARLRPKNFVGLFIAGGPRALRDLRQTDLQGHSPSPFCEELQAFGLQMLRQGGVLGATGHGVPGLPALSADEKAEHAGRFFSGDLDSAATETAKQMVAGLRVSGKLE